MNRAPLFSALLLVSVTARAETTALDQARSAAGKGAIGAEKFDGCVGPTCAIEGNAPVVAPDGERRTPEQAFTVKALPEPVVSEKNAAPPSPENCPPCPPKPWYKNPFVIGGATAGIGALVGLALAPASLPLIGVISGAAIGLFVGYAVARFLFS